MAELARIPVADSELDGYSEQLSKILEYVSELNQANTSEVLGTYNPTGNTNITRADKLSTSLSQSEATRNGQVKDGLFMTSGVFEEK